MCGDIKLVFNDCWDSYTFAWECGLKIGEEACSQYFTMTSTVSNICHSACSGNRPGKEYDLKRLDDGSFAIITPENRL